MSVGAARAEDARALMVELFPEGFEEVENEDLVELAAYTDAAGEERLWAAFGGASVLEVEDGWERRWRDFHRPARVGPLWIGPPWEEAPGDAIPVVIDPGRAFGTGAHATTRLCLAFLDELPRSSLLDVGCGSGVIAVAAAKLGFQPVWAVDIDGTAVEATERNAAENGVELETWRADARDGSLPQAGVTVANIALQTVETVGRAHESGMLLTSGYRAQDHPSLSSHRHVARREADGWAADLYGQE